ncbi:hypothetical protein D3C76_1777380 [compost metagenome]
MFLQPRAEPAVRAIHEYVNQAADDRRYGKRQVDQCDQHLFAAKFEFGDGPSGGHPKDRVQRDGNQRDEQRQP